MTGRADQVEQLKAEVEKLRQHILDINAHATPYGDIPSEPGYVGTYLLTAGALHRALGKIGHSAPNCKAEADLETMRQGLTDAMASADRYALAGGRALLERDEIKVRVEQLQARWARLPEVLAQHSLFQIVCDPATKTDNPICACSLVHLGWHPSIGAATRAWVVHVMEVAERGPGAAQQKETA